MNRKKPESCVGCACYGHGTDFSAIEGTGSSGVLLCGESSGEHEQRDQLPFRPYAPAGSLLTRVLSRMGLDRKMFAITNAARCRPRNNWLEGAPWEYVALNHCRPNLEAAIAQFRPRAIVALGGVALRELTGLSGDKLGISYLAGYPVPLQSRSGMTLFDGNRSVEVPCSEPNEPDGTHHPKCIVCEGLGSKPGYITTIQAGTGAIPVIGDFHPAFLRRGKASYQGVFARILQRGLNIAAGRDRKFTWGVIPGDEATHGTLRYRVHPSLDEARSFAEFVRGNQSLVVSYDLETSESTDLDEDAREGFTDTQIRLVQFSVGAGTGLALPWQGEFRGVARQILQSGNVKCGHNLWLFDNKVLRAVSYREGIDYTPRGVIHDTLQMFHHWQPDLPAHLQFASLFVEFPFPWKHMAAGHIEFYGCADVDATLRLYQFTRGMLEREGLWDDCSYQRVVLGVTEGGSCETQHSIRGYIGQVAEVRPILAAMEERGVPIDDEARQRLGAEFDAAQKTLGEELAKLAPEGCQRVHPKDGYKTMPPEVRKWMLAHNINPKLLGTAQGLFQDELVWRDIFQVRFDDSLDAQGNPKRDKEGNLVEGEFYHYRMRGFDEALEVDGTLATQKVDRWCRVYDFNPNSQAQVLAYMKAKGHPIPKDKHREDDEGNNPETTNKKELVRLARKVNDSFYLKVIEYREYGKVRSVYVDGFKPREIQQFIEVDALTGGKVAISYGTVHTTFTFDTGIGQLSSRNPNVQNFIKHGKLADASRAMIAARPGYVLTEWDFKSCHVLTLGFLAEDLTYIRCARIDMHSLMTGHYLKLWNIHTILRESDDELRARCKWLKANPEWKHVRDAKVKHAGLGIGNGLKYRGLFERYMEYFSSEREAKQILADYEHAFPKVFAWQRKIQQDAHEQQKLVTQFGHIRRFYEVFRWDHKRSSWGHGDQAEEAIAYWLANIAFGHIREKLKQLGAAGLDAKYRLFNNVHDSFMFEVREADIEEHVREVHPVLVAPSTVLKHPEIAPEGLVIGVDAARGKRWNEMEEIKLPKLELSREVAHA